MKTENRDSINQIGPKELESIFPGGQWSNKEYWVNSPLREDNRPNSFSINPYKGCWYDLATDEGGSLEELFRRLGGYFPEKASAVLSTPANNSYEGKSVNSNTTQAPKDKPSAEIPVPNYAVEKLQDHVQQNWAINKFGHYAKHWLYKNKEGLVLFAVVRFEQNKGKIVVPFYYGQDNKWHAGNPYSEHRPLFHLEQLNKEPEKPVLVVEGEKCTDVSVPGYILTTWPGGSSAAKKADWPPLKEREVIVWPDADNAGQKAADKILELLPHAKVLDVNGKQEGWDIADAIEEEVDVLTFIEQRKKPSKQYSKTQTKSENKEIKSQKVKIIELIESTNSELFHYKDDSYITTETGNTLKINEKRFREYCSYLFYKEYGDVPSTQALQDAINTLNGKAKFEGPEKEIKLRIAGDGISEIYYDLKRENKVVHITPEGWSIIDNPGIKFYRTQSMKEISQNPVGNADLTESLKPFMNLQPGMEGEYQWKLLLAMITSAMRPASSYVVTVVTGEQGSAKSVFTRLLQEIIDPKEAALRSQPKNIRDLYIAAGKGHVIGFDNISYISQSISDALCNISTGGTFSTRTLYQDDEETLISLTRPIVLNGITNFAKSSDLIDRSIFFRLPRIDKSTLKNEREFWEEFYRQQPYILGGLFDLMSSAMASLPKQSISFTRMTDFCEWGKGLEIALRWPEGSFQEAYERNRSDMHLEKVEGDPVAHLIKTLMDQEGEWQGTAHELLNELNRRAEKTFTIRKSLPKNATRLKSWLNRIRPNLRDVGIEIEDFRSHGSKNMRIYQNNCDHSDTRDPLNLKDSENAMDAMDAKNRSSSNEETKVQYTHDGGIAICPQ